jgi:hypothetical protein
MGVLAHSLLKDDAVGAALALFGFILALYELRNKLEDL